MNDVKVLISEQVIAKRVKALGEQITKDYETKAAKPPKPIVCIGVLKGAFVFFADLIRHIELPLTLDFVGVSSYGNNLASSQKPTITFAPSTTITNQHVIVVEDIVDTGITLEFLLKHFKAQKPASLKLCILLRKDLGKPLKVKVDYLGFEIDNLFVVGYGLDAAERYRNLPYIGKLT